MGAYEEGIVELERYLALEGSTNKEQRSAALQHIAGCNEALGRLNEAQTAALRGVLEWRESREPWLKVAHTSYRLSVRGWELVFFRLRRCERHGLLMLARTAGC